MEKEAHEKVETQEKEDETKGTLNGVPLTPSGHIIMLAAEDVSVYISNLIKPLRNHKNFILKATTFGLQIL